MIDLAKIKYRLVGVMEDETQIDLTPIATKLGWEEGENELAARVSVKIYNGEYKGQLISEIVQPGMPLFVYYSIDGGDYEEAVRATVEKWRPAFSNEQSVLDITAYDMLNALRHNQDNKHYREGTGTKAIITDILDSWEIPYDYKGPDEQHGKTDFKHRYLSDMILTALKEAKQKGAGVYFARAKEGVVEIIPRGTNETVYHFDELDNAVSISDSFDASKIVTCVVIVGKSDEEGHQAVEATVNGKTEYGHRQIIYEMPKDKSLEEATQTANEMLKEKGSLDRKTTLAAPDLPFLRKGDKIRVRAATVNGYFFVKSIRHNAEDQKMTLDIDEAKEENETEVDTNASDESSEDGDES